MIKALVSGHSRGLGEALAQELTGRGIAVLGLARAALAPHPLLTQVSIDLADTAALAAWLAGPALGEFFHDCSTALLLNNAGTVQPVGALDLQDPARVAQAVGLNVAAPLMLASGLARAAAHAERRIVHISSGAGSSAYPGWSVYCATKAALDHHARAVAQDGLAGLRICSLAPGVIDTAMQAEIRATPLAQFPIRARFVDMKRSGQLATPAHCARAVVDYLLDRRFGARPVDDLRNA